MHTVDLVPLVVVLGTLVISAGYLVVEFVKARKL